MSRIGKKPVSVPQGVEVKISDQLVEVKGKLGTLSRSFHPLVRIDREGDELKVVLRNPKRTGDRAVWGLSRSLLDNMVVGVSTGFTKTLEIYGVGYRAAVSGKVLQLSLGFSHPVDFPIPDGLQVMVEKNTVIQVSGSDIEVIGQACAEIRQFRPPEPYKGKGVRYAGEYVVRKEGKKK